MGKCGKFFSSKCFVAGTLISTPFGDIPIENIKPGDSVYAYDELSKNRVIGIVENIFRSETKETITLHLEGQTIESTGEHPYYVIGRGWIEASQINVGDILQNIYGDYVKVEKIETTNHTHPINVFNFKVKDYHTYFVSAAKILVHNANCGMKNIRTLEKTKIKNYKVSMDIERGGSGLTNIHAEVDGVKYFWNGTKFLSKNGKEIPKVLRDHPTIIKALKKALEKITKGAI